MEDEDLICTDCNRRTEVVYDHASGDIVCSECGLVLESYYIDDTSEWRTFSDSLHDPCRVGKALDPLLSSQPLTTSISISISIANASVVKGTGVAAAVKSKPDRLLSAMQTISSMADRLSLVQTIVSRANEIFKKVIIDTNTASWKGKKYSDAMCAACLFVACQLECLPRTFKEVCSVVDAKRKDVARANHFIMQHLNHYSNTNNDNGNDVNKKRNVRAAVFVRRFCSNLGMMDNRATRAAIQAAETTEEDFDVRRSPVSLAAAAIYIVTRFLEEVKRPTLREVAVATGVAEGTIKNVCKDSRPHVGKIVPSWFASEAQLKIVGSL